MKKYKKHTIDIVLEGEKLIEKTFKEVPNQLEYVTKWCKKKLGDHIIVGLSFKEAKDENGKSFKDQFGRTQRIWIAAKIQYK